MTQDKFVQLMVESGLARYVQTEKTCVSNALERFAALVAAHEREACAKVCEEEITIDDEAFNDGVNACINSIKLRSK